MIAVPITLRDANVLVAHWHRHHKPARGCNVTFPEWKAKQAGLL